MKKTIFIFTIFAAIAFIISCSKSSGGGGGTTSCNLNVSFSTNIKRIIDANCAGCHSSTTGTDPNAKAKWSYDGSYSNAFAKRDLIKSLVSSGQMPQSGTLPQLVKDSVVCWVDKGAPN